MAAEITSVGVVGLGTMGAGIAEVFARSGLADHVGRLLRRAEYVDEIDGFGHVGQAGIARLVPDLVGVRIHRDDAPAVQTHLQRDRVRGLVLVPGGAHDRDRGRLLEDLSGTAHD